MNRNFKLKLLIALFAFSNIFNVNAASRIIIPEMRGSCFSLIRGNALNIGAAASLAGMVYCVYTYVQGKTKSVEGKVKMLNDLLKKYKNKQTEFRNYRKYDVMKKCFSIIGWLDQYQSPDEIFSEDHQKNQQTFDKIRKEILGHKFFLFNNTQKSVKRSDIRVDELIDTLIDNIDSETDIIDVIDKFELLKKALKNDKNFFNTPDESLDNLGKAGFKQNLLKFRETYSKGDICISIVNGSNLEANTYLEQLEEFYYKINNETVKVFCELVNKYAKLAALQHLIEDVKLNPTKYNIEIRKDQSVGFSASVGNGGGIDMDWHRFVIDRQRQQQRAAELLADRSILDRGDCKEK